VHQLGELLLEQGGQQVLLADHIGIGDNGHRELPGIGEDLEAEAHIAGKRGRFVPPLDLGAASAPWRRRLNSVE
jgi:hypothetical protein